MYGGFRHRCHDRDTDRADLRCDETDFYRNFQDKYDLINWYFDKLLLESFAQMGDGLTVYEGLTRKFEFIQKERVFFAGAFRSDDHNSLREHDYELILDFIHS